MATNRPENLVELDLSGPVWAVASQSHLWS